MKRYGHLYDKIISVDNLRLADANARRGKRHNRALDRHDCNREADIQALHIALRDHTYRTSPYNHFSVHEPKERIISSLPYYPDRIVHHAIVQVLEPIWRKTLTHNTFACIKGRGITACIDYTARCIRRHRNAERLYCLKIDIRKYYNSVDHGVLKSIIRRKIKDREVLALLDEIIDSHDGLPIGNYTSQFFANIYLAYLMHHINEDLHLDAVEYADDIVVFAEDKATLHNALADIRGYIESQLHLQVKDNWQIFPIADNRQDRRGRSLDYVGYCTYRYARLLRKRIKHNLCRAISRLRHRLTTTAKEFKQAIAPWIGWARHCNSRNLFTHIIPQEYASII